MRIDDKSDAVIKIVEFKILLKKAELRLNPVSDCPFSEARQPPLYMRGMRMTSNISEISNDCSSMSQRKIPESSF